MGGGRYTRGMEGGITRGGDIEGGYTRGVNNVEGE